ncbi:sodium/calcium exchanger membrane region [Roseiflexus castenholzii DSM 13941]|uniref:Sodium/calcium exchanger membrane region n=2 Tax=Roseiflexus castenholzii TaxID=120962 RepID=A7NRX9_ROSCS|nr:sodium/calcium exchanger membrane region [Roseiflexus castenholzii DSM 13941]
MAVSCAWNVQTRTLYVEGPPMLVTWLLFIACAAVILVAGTQLSRYGDVIADMTGLGRTWIGVVLLASVTSLPELITGFSSVAIYRVPDIAMGDIAGSCMFNLLIIAILDALHGPAPISGRVHEGQVLSASFGLILLGLVGLSIALGEMLPAIGWVSVSSALFLAIYLLAMRTIFTYEQRRIVAEFVAEMATETEARHPSPARVYGLFTLNAVLIVGAALYLPGLAETLAETTGLGQTFFGTIFVALSTSLPEVVVSIAALRIGAIDMAVGNIFGSNLFNIGILALDDLFYTPGPLLAAIEPSHIIAVLAAMIMTAIAIVGLTYRSDSKRLFIAWDALGIAVVYALANAALYLQSGMR